MTVNGHIVSFGDDENSLELERVRVVKFVPTLKTTALYILKG